MSNPLLQEFNTPYNTIPFDKIELEHYLPAFKKCIEIGKAEIETIKENSEAPDFSNTIETLERNASQLDLISGIFFNINSAETNDEMQKLAQEVSPLLTAYSNDITLDEDLFKKIKEAYQNTDKTQLDDEQLTLLEKTYKSFVRNGANLKNEKKQELKEINTELSKLSLTYSENVLKATNGYELWIDDKKDLEGLPESFNEAAQMDAKEKGKENCWLVTLDYPSYIPFMTYADSRQLREKLFLAFGSKAFSGEFSNQKLVKQIVSLRQKRAQILGYSTHANYVLEERMAKTPTSVYKLLEELLVYAMPVAQTDVVEVQAMSDKLNGPKKIERWDYSYYSEKLKKERYNIDDEILKPYFQLEKVIDGAFTTAKKLFNIEFIQRNDIPVYHKDVMTYDVVNSDKKHVAVFYADFFPRAGKRNGAWMTSYKGQNKYDEKEQRPHVSIVCNFTKPTESAPSLLTFNEVTTLFHEFGHALHGMLADGHYESLSGTSVYWDFVELPSQIMENWCYEKECLNLFASHYKTNEPIPIEMIQKIKDSVNFQSGYQTVRQVSFSKLDMGWHDVSDNIEDDVSTYESKLTQGTNLLPRVKETNMSCSFSHIFAGGYSAGYYSYKWAEVLEADAFEYFLETGIFNSETAQKFKDNILSKGGSEHPMTLYKRFRGKEPSTKPLLRKSGLL